jgi:hypothetical protein
VYIDVLQGGLSTTEEMCLSFIIFYPAPADGSALFRCVSLPAQSALQNFVLDSRLEHLFSALLSVADPGRVYTVSIEASPHCGAQTASYRGG